MTEYLVRYVDLIFNDKIPTFAHSTNGVEGTPKKCRPKSLAISTPTKLISIEEARTRALNTAIKPDQKYIEVGEYRTPIFGVCTVLICLYNFVTSSLHLTLNSFNLGPYHSMLPPTCDSFLR